MPKTIKVIQCFQCNKFFKFKNLREVSRVDKDGKNTGKAKMCLKCLGVEDDSLEALLKKKNIKIK